MQQRSYSTRIKGLVSPWIGQILQLTPKAPEPMDSVREIQPDAKRQLCSSQPARASEMLSDAGM